MSAAEPAPPVRSAEHDGVVTITIDRPRRRNALNLESLELLDAAVRQAAGSGARAIVLTGAEGHFCAGADLSELEDVSFTKRLAEVLEHLAGLPVVTVAAISGACMGLGIQLAVGCDVRVATDDARFAIPVARLGLMVDYWTMDRARRFFGEGAVRAMVLCGEVLTAQDAWRLGAVQRCGDLSVAQEMAANAAALAPLTQAGSKLGFDLPPGGDRAAYVQAFHRAWASEDLQEGRAAFRERRTARFRGR